MTTFLRLLAEKDKGEALRNTSHLLRQGNPDSRVFEVDPNAFKVIPGTPFSYWVPYRIRKTFLDFQPFESEGRTARIGMKTGDDFRFLRIWWEPRKDFVPYSKGGTVQSFYGDLPIAINWKNNGSEVKQFVTLLHSVCNKCSVMRITNFGLAIKNTIFAQESRGLFEVRDFRHALCRVIPSSLFVDTPHSLHPGMNWRHCRS
jgi:hypothetical protein